MKETLYRFRLPLIIAAVILLFIIIAVVLRTGKNTSSKGTTDYFSQSQYPVTCKENKDGSLLITLDGSATPELSWSVENESEDLCELTEKSGGKSDVITLHAKPLATGYADFVVKREKEMGEKIYDVAVIRGELIISENADGTFKAHMSEIYQDATTTGGADSEDPYIIEGNRILLPTGGDWTAVETTADGGEAAGIFDIETGRNDDGIDYIDVYPTVDRVVMILGQADVKGENDEQVTAYKNARLIIKSDSQGVSTVYKYRLNDIGDGEFYPSGEKIQAPETTTVDGTASETEEEAVAGTENEAEAAANVTEEENAGN